MDSSLRFKTCKCMQLQQNCILILASVGLWSSGSCHQTGCRPLLRLPARPPVLSVSSTPPGASRASCLTAGPNAEARSAHLSGPLLQLARHSQHCSSVLGFILTHTGLAQILLITMPQFDYFCCYSTSAVNYSNIATNDNNEGMIVFLLVCRER